MSEQASTGRPSPPWWVDGVIYQIYPRSFADANGDGIGDLRASRATWTTWSGWASTPSG